MIGLHIAGHSKCGAFAKAIKAAGGLSLLYPAQLSVTVLEYETKEEYNQNLPTLCKKTGAGDHATSPIVWFDDNKYLGGRDETFEWCKNFVAGGAGEGSSHSNLRGGATSSCHSHGAPNTDVFNKEHDYDYDCIVIGGGSGGLAASKEAVKQGAKVAVLDFVTPSPHGSTWGLGGTCVNVGCIPKKLMHTAALMGEHIKSSASYGWKNTMINAEGKHNDGNHDWTVMKSHVQDHIKSLNFGYRVSLREAGVTYLNKKGKFISDHEIECTDSKGRTSTISAARFVIAVGGRPSLLDCPGGELAISSDDLFSLPNAPGKTCVVGAGYVAMECAGFLTGLAYPTTVLVRSKPLRGFDSEVVEKVHTYMEKQGTDIKIGVLPQSIAKTETGKLLVTYSTGDAEEFDTVLCAVGRKADTISLGLDACGLTANANNGKLTCCNEQTTVPHIYAIGDVVEGAPELTPSAIMSGRLLAKRLFGHSKKLMDYSMVATTVFTPLEMGTLGLSEVDAIEKYGQDSVDCLISSFTPLEWLVLDDHEGNACYSKIVVNTKQDNRVIGMHIAAPNAGEIIQGYAVAIKKGITHQDLLDTVGIHPTVTEELVGMEISKSSGESADKVGC